MALDERLERVFVEVFGVKPVNTTSILTLEEWDSLAHVTLIMELELEFGVAIADWEAIEATSIPDIRKLLISRGIK